MDIEYREIDEFVVTGQEAQGDTVKDWVWGPNTLGVEGHAIFKPSREDAKNRSRHEPNAERAAYLVAQLLGVPCAEVELVTRGGKRGCLSWDVRTCHDVDLVPGIGLLRGHMQSYDRAAPLKKRDPLHRLENIEIVLRDSFAPISLAPGLNAFDCFVGYLLFDALIGNDDRHGFNWAVERRSGDTYLAPSFDHGSALGIIARDKKSLTYLSDPAAFSKYRRNNRAKQFADHSSKTSREFALAAWKELKSADARTQWSAAFARLRNEDLYDAVYASGIDGAVGEFSARLICANLMELKEGMEA